MKKLLILVGILFCATTLGSAQIATQELFVGIPTMSFNYAAASQQTDHWCWAASIQMVLQWYGIPVTQPEIVAHVFGAPVITGGSDQAIAAALNSWGVNRNGQTVMIHAVSAQGPPPVGVLLQQLGQQHPILVTFRTGPASGHCIVITGAGYFLTPSGPVVNDLIYRDPWPSPPNQINQGRVELTGQDLSQFLPTVQSNFLVWVTP